MMKRIMAWMAAAATLTFAVPIAGGQKDPRLASLFEALAAAPTATESLPIEARIWEIWTESGNLDLDRLMALGITAMNHRDYRTAYASFTTVIEEAPDFAEGWNKRATVLYLMGEYERSAADVARTLALEPRHFGALSGLGLIKLAQHDEKAALAAFERALVIYPHMAGAETHIRELRERIKGRET